MVAIGYSFSSVCTSMVIVGKYFLAWYVHGRLRITLKAPKDGILFGERLWSSAPHRHGISRIDFVQSVGTEDQPYALRAICAHGRDIIAGYTLTCNLWARIISVHTSGRHSSVGKFPGTPLVWAFLSNTTISTQLPESGNVW